MAPVATALASPGVRLAIDRDLFKSVLRRWASGVTIVTTRAGGRDHGMTVSSFSSVSLDPPLVLVCADKKANTLPAIAESGAFAVNVLAQGQQALSNRFAKIGNEAERFDCLDCRRGPSGSPWIPEAHAVLDCRVAAVHDAGDHVIYVGEVLAAEIDETSEPLVYYDARYAELAPRSA
ncbi:MAG: flavin reductase [Proteobacteria bacterium]|nr:MAG: flavin reductase [Pseudomonadota bacterium]